MDMRRMAEDIWTVVDMRPAWRNAQASVIAPTGTIGQVMDCDTTGIEPDFALAKFKKLAGGSYFKFINRTLPEPLQRLVYTLKQIHAMPTHAVGRDQRPHELYVHHTSSDDRGSGVTQPVASMKEV